MPLLVLSPYSTPALPKTSDYAPKYGRSSFLGAVSRRHIPRLDDDRHGLRYKRPSNSSFHKCLKPFLQPVAKTTFLGHRRKRI